MAEMVARLRTRAEIRRKIPRGEPDRISDDCEQAADFLEALQAKIDALMWEYCPGKMTSGQIAEWGRHQVAVEDPDLGDQLRNV